MAVDRDETRLNRPRMAQATLAPAFAPGAVLPQAAPEEEAPSPATPLDFALLLLEEAHHRIHAVNDYSAEFLQQERIGGVLGEPNRIRLKVRHQPFSVYMGWIEPNEGREVIYVDGRDDNRLLAHEGGWKRLLVPMVRLDPFGTQAMKTSRHPITEVGIAYLTDRILEDRRREQSIPTVEVSYREERMRNGRTCWRFEHVHTVYDETQYSRVVFGIDKELGVPVWCETYDWPAGANSQGEMLESYYYGDLQFDVGMTDQDFDVDNPGYGFKRL